MTANIGWSTTATASTATTIVGAAGNEVPWAHVILLRASGAGHAEFVIVNEVVLLQGPLVVVAEVAYG